MTGERGGDMTENVDIIMILEQFTLGIIHFYKQQFD